MITKALPILALTIFTSSAFATDYNCSGVGYYDHLNVKLDIKHSFWSSDVKGIKFTDTINEDTYFTMDEMILGASEYTAKGIKSITRLSLSESSKIESLEYFNYSMGKDDYYFDSRLVEGKSNGWLFITDRPAAFCMWDACNTKHFGYYCKRK